MPLCDGLGHFLAVPRQPADDYGVFHEAHEIGIFEDINKNGADALRRFPCAALDDHG